MVVLVVQKDGFWDKGSFYDRLTDVHGFGIEADADEIGGAVAVATGVAIAAHAAASTLKSAKANQENIK